MHTKSAKCMAILNSIYKSCKVRTYTEQSQGHDNDCGVPLAASLDTIEGKRKGRDGDRPMDKLAKDGGDRKDTCRIEVVK